MDHLFEKVATIISISISLRYAKSLEEQHKRKEAIKLNEKCLDLLQSLNSRSAEVEISICSNLYSLHEGLGEHRKCIDYAEKWLVLATKIESKSLQSDAACNLGNAFYRLGDCHKAIEYHKRDLATSFELLDKRREGRAYMNLGGAYRSLQCWPEALSCHKKQLNVSRELDDKHGESLAYHSLGECYLLIGSFRAAVVYFEKCLALAQEGKDKRVECGTNMLLGKTYVGLRDFARAKECLEKSLHLSKDTHDRPAEAAALDALGFWYGRLQKFRESVEYLKKSLEIYRMLDLPAEKARTLVNLGDAHRCAGEIEQSIQAYQESLVIAKNIVHKYIEAHCYHSLGFVYLTENDVFPEGIQRSIQYFNLANECYDQLRPNVGESDSFKITYGERHVGSFKFLSVALYLSGQTAEAMCAAEGARSRPLADKMASNYAGKSPVLTQTAITVDDLKPLVMRTEAPIVYMSFCRYLGATFVWLLQEDGKIASDMNGTSQKPLYVIHDLPAVIADVILEIGIKVVQNVKCEDRSLNNADGDYSKGDDDDDDDDDNDRRGTYTLAKRGAATAVTQGEATDALSLLYNVIFSPIATAFPSLDSASDPEIPKPAATNPAKDCAQNLEQFPAVAKTQNKQRIPGLVFAPDRDLFLAPFAALKDGHGRYLSESYRIRVVPSLMTLKLIHDSPSNYHSESGALIVGDPNVGLVSYKGQEMCVGRLPCAGKEAKMIGTILKVTPLIGNQATKSKVLQRISSVSLIHIAAHGHAQCGEIALSPTPLPQRSDPPCDEDFLLGPSDLENTRLHAKLVVLSCCYTGRGEIKSEGVIGIARMFLGAGARSVLVTLWAIDDEATLFFMRAFYECLYLGQCASLALNKAMRQLRESDRFSAPKYWAPFTLIGDDVSFQFSTGD